MHIWYIHIYRYICSYICNIHTYPRFRNRELPISPNPVHFHTGFPTHPCSIVVFPFFYSKKPRMEPVSVSLILNVSLTFKRQTEKSTRRHGRHSQQRRRKLVEEMSGLKGEMSFIRETVLSPVTF